MLWCSQGAPLYPPLELPVTRHSLKRKPRSTTFVLFLEFAAMSIQPLVAGLWTPVASVATQSALGRTTLSGTSMVIWFAARSVFWRRLTLFQPLPAHVLHCAPVPHVVRTWSVP